MCGRDEIVVEDLMQNVRYTFGFTDQSATIKTLWSVVKSKMSREERLKLLQFVTGSRRVPVGGFSALRPRFTIQRLADLNRLPSASTCFSLLKLPDYGDDHELLLGKLRLVLQESVEGFAFS